jgi:hypothetical protein
VSEKLDGLVYFVVTSQEDGPLRCKIGYTKGEPQKRLQALQCGSPAKLSIYCAFAGNKATEKRFHDTFAPLRLHGEWFEVKGKLQDFMIALLDDAMTRRPADWTNVLIAVEVVILADEPIRDTDDKDEYLASANTEPWEWMREALAAIDAEEVE